MKNAKNLLFSVFCNSIRPQNENKKVKRWTKIWTFVESWNMKVNPTCQFGKRQTTS